MSVIDGNLTVKGSVTADNNLSVGDINAYNVTMYGVFYGNRYNIIDLTKNSDLEALGTSNMVGSIYLVGGVNPGIGLFYDPQLGDHFKIIVTAVPEGTIQITCWRNYFIRGFINNRVVETQSLLLCKPVIGDKYEFIYIGNNTWHISTS